MYILFRFILCVYPFSVCTKSPGPYSNFNGILCPFLPRFESPQDWLNGILNDCITSAWLFGLTCPAQCFPKTSCHLSLNLFPVKDWQGDKSPDGHSTSLDFPTDIPYPLKKYCLYLPKTPKVWEKPVKRIRIGPEYNRNILKKK